MIDLILDRTVAIVTSDKTMAVGLGICVVLFVFATFGAIELAFLRLSARFTWIRIPRWVLPRELR